MKTILIIDDEKRIRDIYMRILEALDFEVLNSGDAREATNVIIREKVDLVLLDIKMPQINGREMFEVLHEYDPELKVIVSSVYPVEKQRQLIPFADDYFDKSEGVAILTDKVMTVLADEG